MKRVIALVLSLCLLLMSCAALAADFYDVLTFRGGFDVSLPTVRVPVRTGPSTEFTERATYTLKKARVISKSTDNRGTTWVQIEFKYNSQITRGYTTEHRLVNAGYAPQETCFNQLSSRDMCEVYYSQWAYTGPGYEYMRSDDFCLYDGVTYWLVAQENGWGLVQTADTGFPMWRGWVPLGELIY